MITIVDYGLGNVKAYMTIYKQLGLPSLLAQDTNNLLKASKLILPGVGAFDWAIQRLQSSGMREALYYLVLEKQVPVMGVCIGMQMMADHSEEGDQPGLCWIKGNVKRLDSSISSVKTPLPHMGWNDVDFKTPLHPLFNNINDPRFYFLHS